MTRTPWRPAARPPGRSATRSARRPRRRTIRTSTSSPPPHSHRATCTSVTSAPTRSATRTRASDARAARTCCSRSASTPSGCPRSSARSPAASLPSEWVARCAEHMKGQLLRLGFSLDWERSFLSSDALMYRWSQWLFLTLYETGLVYRGTGTVDWCDHCQTTLASIQVEPGGTCWRCHNPVRLIELPQWYFKVSAYVTENDRRLGEREAQRQMGQARARLAVGRDGPRRRCRARADGRRRLDGQRVHPPRRRGRGRPLRGDLAAPSGGRALGGRPAGRRAARADALGRMGAQRARRRDDPADRGARHARGARRSRAAGRDLAGRRRPLRPDDRARHPRRGPHRRGVRAAPGTRRGGARGDARALSRRGSPRGRPLQGLRLGDLAPALVGNADPDRLLRGLRHGAAAEVRAAGGAAARHHPDGNRQPARGAARPSSRRAAPPAAVRRGARPTRWTATSTRCGCGCRRACPPSTAASRSRRSSRSQTCATGCPPSGSSPARTAATSSSTSAP